MTLVELLVVIAIVAILASLVLSALSNAKADGKKAGCLGNLKQFELAYQMYAADNGGSLAQNVPLVQPYASPMHSNSWVYGDMKNLADATNPALLQAGELFPYLSQGGIYRCPADPSKGDGGPRLRSYSMNAWCGSMEMETLEPDTGYRVFFKEKDFAAGTPAGTWIIIDEHILTLSDGWFMVTMDNSHPFARFPATRHLNGYCLNFADGHADSCRLLTPVCQIPENPSEAFSEEEPPLIGEINPDWIKLRDMTTTH
jgi:prepilin-type N-terminal cleavage/methylation domain-containing protein